jgi:hypothetical protein
MGDWPDWRLGRASANGEEYSVNQFRAASSVVTGQSAEERDRRRGRVVTHMPWRLASDEALIVEFDNYGGFWMFTNMGVFFNSMDYAYRNVSYTPSRAVVDSDNKVRLIMTHEDPGYHNWLDTQGYETGYLSFRDILGRRTPPPIHTTTVKLTDLAAHLPPDCQKIDAVRRHAQLNARFDGIRRRYRL